MKAIHILCIVTIAVACAAQQSDSNASSSTLKLSPTEADKLLVERVVPQYPEAGITNQIQNNELLRLQIDEQGNVIDARVESGHPAFAQASLDAVKQWRYHPYLVNDSPVRFETMALIAYRFSGPSSFPTPKNALFNVVAMKPAEGVPAEPPPLQIGSYELEEMLLKRVEPQYPELAKITHIQGDVVIFVQVDKQGHVASLSGISGHPILVQAAIEAAKQWNYKPFAVRGEAVTVESTVRMQFRMDDSANGTQPAEKQ